MGTTTTASDARCAMAPRGAHSARARSLPLLAALLLVLRAAGVAHAALQYDYLNVYNCPAGYCLDQRCARSPQPLTSSGARMMHRTPPRCRCCACVGRARAGSPAPPCRT